RPDGEGAGTPGRPGSATEAEISYYQGQGLRVEDVLREQVLLAVPVKAICREECKGLCPHCGRNLNLEQCSCAEPVEDPRWAALKDIRRKLQQNERNRCQIQNGGTQSSEPAAGRPT